ncbi:MAG: VanZ family protein [bacterium]
MKNFKLLIVFLWCLLIFLLSNQDATTSANTSTNFTKVVINVVEFIFNRDFDDQYIIDACFSIVRKGAHFTLFFILGFVVCSTLKEYIYGKLYLYSFGICLFFAISDEFHQLFLEGRTAQISDVFVDSFGAAGGILLYFLYNKFKFYRMVHKRE